MASRTVEVILKASDQFSDATTKLKLQMAAATIATDDLNKSIEKLQQKHPGLSLDEATEAAKALQNASQGADAAGKSFANANIAARGLGQEFGITLPRAVTSFLAQSKLVGPALSAAFSAVAVVGLIEVLGQIPALYDKMAASVTGWNEAARKAYQEQIALNEKFIDVTKDAAKAQIERQVKAGTLSEVGGVQANLANLQAELQAQGALNAPLATEQYKRQLRTGLKPMGELSPDDLKLLRQPDTEMSAEELTDKLKTGTDKANELAVQIQRLERVGMPNAAAEDVNKQKQRDADAVAALERRQALLDRMAEVTMELYDGIAKSEEIMWRKTEQHEEAVERLQERIYDAYFETRALEMKLVEDWQRGQDTMAEVTLEIQLASIEVERKLKERSDKQAAQVVKSFQDVVGKFWDDFFLKGKGAFGDLVNLAKEMFKDFTKNIVEGLATSVVFGGKGGGGGAFGGLLGGIVGKISGKVSGGAMSEAIPGGGGLSSGGGLLGAIGGLLFKHAAPDFVGPIAPATGIAGALGLGGGAGLLGLGAATIPVIGGIAAGAALIAMAIFGNHHDAPFTRDPNAIQNTREYLFYTGVQDLAVAAKDMLNFTHQLNTLPTGTLVKQGLPVALASSNQFRRDVSAVLNQDL